MVLDEGVSTDSRCISSKIQVYCFHKEEGNAGFQLPVAYPMKATGRVMQTPQEGKGSKWSDVRLNLIEYFCPTCNPPPRPLSTSWYIAGYAYQR